MNTTKQLIKLENELSERNAEHYKKHGCVNPILTNRINLVREAIKENAIGALI